MKNLLKIFLLLSGLLSASGCFSPRFIISPPNLPDEAPDRVFIEADPGLSRSFATSLGKRLGEHGIYPDTNAPSAPGAILRVGLEAKTFDHPLSKHGSMIHFVPRVPRLLLDAKIMNMSEGNKTYLSIGLPLNGAVFGATMTHYKRVETLGELTDRAAHLVSVIYLNAQRGEPQAIEGRWVGADGQGAMIFYKGSGEGSYSATAVNGPAVYANTVSYVISALELGNFAEDTPYNANMYLGGPVDNLTHFKGRYKITLKDSYYDGESSWVAVHLHIYGCLMVVEGTTGRAILVKQNAGRCVSPDPSR
jgi:hypothetical protein